MAEKSHEDSLDDDPKVLHLKPNRLMWNLSNRDLVPVFTEICFSSKHLGSVFCTPSTSMGPLLLLQVDSTSPTPPTSTAAQKTYKVSCCSLSFFRRMHVHFTTPIFRVMLEHLVGTNGFNNGFLGSVGLLCPMLSKAGETNAMKCLRRLVQPRADGSFLVPEEIIQKFKDIAGGGRSEVLRLYEQCGCNKDPF